MRDASKKIGRYRHTVSDHAQPSARLLCRLGQIDEAFASHRGGLHNSKISLLRLIRSAGRRGLSQAVAAELLDMTPGALSKICDELEKSTLIERLQHPVDRRIRQLSLTSAGEAHLDTCNEMLEVTARDAFSNLNAAEVELLLNLLSKVNFSTDCDRCASCRIGGC